MEKEPIIEYLQVKDNPEINIRVCEIQTQVPKYKNRTIFLIPGWLSEIDLFVPTAKELSRFGNVLIYEPRGYGQSQVPHKKGLFTPTEYNKEIAKVLELKKIRDKEFIIFGSCSGGGMAFNYYLDGEGSKPLALAIISPQPHYDTPFWLPIFGVLPNFIMTGIQKIIILFMNIWLKFKNPEEVKNVIHAKEQLTKNDAWCQRRFVVEYIIPYDIRDRLSEIDIPMIGFVGKKDHFLDLEQSKGFLDNPKSRLVELEETAHRIQEGNEELMAKEVHNFLLDVERRE